jgi:hypothetical protein
MLVMGQALDACTKNRLTKGEKSAHPPPPPKNPPASHRFLRMEIIKYMIKNRLFDFI